MNSEKYLSQIATNTANIAISEVSNNVALDHLDASIDNVSNPSYPAKILQVAPQVFQNYSNTYVPVSIGKAVVDTGTQRVCICDDDTNTSAINTSTQTVADCVDTGNHLVNTKDKSIHDAMWIANSKLPADFVGVKTYPACNYGNVYTYLNSGPGNINDGPNYQSGGGDVLTLTQRVVIANDDTNMSAVKTDLDEVYACIDHTNKHVEVDTNAINGVTMDVNAGNNSAGTQRVCISTDDVNLASIKTTMDHLNVCIDTEITTVLTDQTTIQGSIVSTNAGTLDFGTQRVCIATDDANLAAINTNTTEIYNCIDHVNKHVEVDTNAINGVTMAVNSGNNGNGVQRVCIANDDANISYLTNTIQQSLYLSNGGNPVDQISIKSSPATYNYSGVNTFLMSGSGNISATPTYSAFATSNRGLCQRVCIASDDVNISTINTNTATLAGAVSSAKIQANIAQINSTTIPTNSGNKDGGTQRICIATDDVNTLSIKNSLKTSLFFNNGVLVGTPQDALYVRTCPFIYGGSPIVAYENSGKGNVADPPTYNDIASSGLNQVMTPRVCIATDDVNISAMKAKIDSIYTILNDVYDSTNHYLKVHTV